MTLEQKIEALVSPAIEALGLEFWGCEYVNSGKDWILRIYIDEATRGVTVDDCEDVSRQVSSILDVEDPIKSAYLLEISSPGLDRPFFKPSQYLEFVGETLRVTAHTPVLGRRRFKGEMIAANSEQIELEVDGEVYELPFDNIDKANLVIEL